MEALTPVLVHIPKTGGRSISKMLGIHPDHLRASESPHGYRFAFVRHPFDRFLSGFFDSVDLHDLPDDADANEFVMERLEGEIAETTWRPMSWWLDEPVDFIGRFEAYSEGVRHVWAGCGIGEPTEIPHVGKSSNPGQSVLSASAKARLREIYCDDFSRFGYQA